MNTVRNLSITGTKQEPRTRQHGSRTHGIKSKHFLILLCCTVIFVITTIRILAESRTPLPTVADVARVWIGDGIRLELDTNGTGYFCQSFPIPNTSPYLYQITDWAISNFVVQVKTRPIDDAPVRTFGKFRYSKGILAGELDKQKIRLFTENQWQTLAAQNRERIAQQRNQKP